MTPQAEFNLKLAILRELDLPSGLMMPEPTLMNRLRCTQPEPPLQCEMSKALQTLEHTKLVVAVRPELGGPIRWKLTEAGRAELAQYSQ